MALLEVKNLGISFGGLRAVDRFEVEIKKGQLYGLIGPNGAGKTTVFNLSLIHIYTGVQEAAIKAVETVDTCVGNAVAALKDVYKRQDLILWIFLK